MANLSQLFNSFKNHVYNVYGPNPAKMLIYTGVLGWFLSSAAQVVAIAVNDKIPKEQKAFLIPQEIGDGAVNVLSFLVVTSAIKGLASRLVSTGKLAKAPLRAIYEKAGLTAKTGIGKAGMDVVKELQTRLPKAEFDTFVKDYNRFKKGTDVIGMTVGSILSCNIITPLLRNKFAAKRQRREVARMHSKELIYPRGITMDSYLNHVYSSSASLRV